MLNRRQGLQAAAALAGVALSGRSARAQAAPAVVSLSEQRSRFLLEVGVDGAEGYRFVLDTGASTHFISTRLVEQLRLPRIEERMVRGYAGRNRDSVVGISRFTVGGVEMGAIRAVAWAPERLDDHDGLIGYPFLFPRAVISLGTGRLSLGGGETSPPLTPVKARVMRDQTLLLGGIEGAEGRFVFDTGSQSCTISGPYYRRVQATEAYKSAAKLFYRDAAGETRNFAFRPARMSFGAFTLEEPVVRISREEREGLFHEIDGLFGVSLLRPYTWAIDQAAGSLQVGGAAPQRLSYFGSGLRVEHSGGLARVSAVVDGGPAFEAGVRPGQQVLSLSGEPPARWDRAFLGALTPSDRATRQMVELVDRGVRRTAVFDTRALL